jgi:two-component system alkaline phosphatase synthesis response regulator PhoP
MICAQILLVCDDSETGRIWSYGLAQNGLEVFLSHSAEEALSRWIIEPFDLIIIDVYTPKLDGIELCRQLRPQQATPILLLADNAEEPIIVKAYQAGVDEYIVKPLSPRLFLIKVTAWLRRTGAISAEETGVLEVGDLCLDMLQRQVVLADGSTTRLSNLEFRLLRLFMSHSGQTLPGDLIVSRVWGHIGEGDNKVLKSIMYRLRRKIEPDPRSFLYLQTVPGGYRFNHVS